MEKKVNDRVISIFALFLSFVCSCVTQDDLGYDAKWISGVPTCSDGGYLFAFITKNEYYKLHYALSRDGYNWTTLNNGEVLLDEYWGHPDICKGPDGVYRMIGVFPTTLWETTDLINWTKRDLPKEVFDRSNEFGYYTVDDIGAPKLFYDSISSQYIITWHACKTPNNNDWRSMTTLYVLTNDFVEYSFPQKLFNFTGDDADICIIDTRITYVDGYYYAILKDERMEYACPTGKTIRISKGKSLTGPFNCLSEPITPIGVPMEAPILVKLPEDSGWALYTESYYIDHTYRMFVSDKIEGEWIEKQFNCPKVNDASYPNARHGCIVRISENIYKGLVNKYR